MHTLLMIIVWGLVAAVLIYNCIAASRKWPAAKEKRREEKLKLQNLKRLNPENLK
jgi:hypothetical protein